MTSPLESPGRGQVLDRGFAVVALALLLVLCLLTAYLGLFIAMYSDGCTGPGEDCNEGLINLGVLIASPGQVLPAALAGGWLRRRWSAGRSVWFVPLVVAPLPLMLIALGGTVASLGLD